MNSFHTSFRCRFIRSNCALRESVESEERVFGLGMLGVGVMEAGIGRSTLVPGGPEGSSGEGCGPTLSSRYRTRGRSHGVEGSCCIYGEVCCGSTVRYWEDKEARSRSAEVNHAAPVVGTSARAPFGPTDGSYTKASIGAVYAQCDPSDG
ncbi:hypothetical protein B296_00004199 [Ensete ventricosum]|uniref:Uncharacterized protein n=1 Tax=Ensete ventricosum TaxID=4639 RepID=A0A426XW38_ENSVE|nr:hypothetical protein B296_00004199 [Ensete ventricosum]